MSAQGGHRPPLQESLSLSRLFNRVPVQYERCHVAFAVFSKFDLCVDILEEETGVGFRKQRVFELPDRFGDQLAAAIHGDHKSKTGSRQVVSPGIRLQNRLRHCDLLSLWNSSDYLVSAILVKQEVRDGAFAVSDKLEVRVCTGENESGLGTRWQRKLR